MLLFLRRYHQRVPYSCILRIYRVKLCSSVNSSVDSHTRLLRLINNLQHELDSLVSRPGAPRADFTKVQTSLQEIRDGFEVLESM